MVDSYDRLSFVWPKRLMAIRPDGVVQRRDAPSLMNASQRGFGCYGDQVITFPPRPGVACWISVSPWTADLAESR
ncbi:hypothetical protein BHE74_00015237 [Ensete ventricosum]|nr:hypothetical protein GW17_00033531 [Ensete ventricosum]RWW76659.1 hypothetical protein BHE74_00015237 [Ensete ventricosum]RZR87002.1 hypothetical protein BHM03_00014287 [Ensete ventricosum]